ncbi:MAG: prepilin-type N-terminal cleavage/methylation domain-containing protein [Cyanobacteria bacterium J06639_1]
MMRPSAPPVAPYLGSNARRGFALLEVLASVVIVLVALAALSPTLVIAAATRIQSRRIEAATNLAYQELDRARQVLDRGPGNYAAADLPKVVTLSDFAKTPPSGDVITVGEFRVQVFRDAGIDCPAPNDSTPCFFKMGARVYSEQAFSGSTYTGSTDVTPLAGNVAGAASVLKAKERPLAFVTAEIGSQTTLEQYCTYLASASC